MPLQVLDQPLAIAGARLTNAQRIELKRDAVQAEGAPQPCAHREMLGVDVRSGKTERLHSDLVELPVAALLRTLVAEHRSPVPQSLRSPVEQAVFDHRAHASGRGLGAQREALAVELVDEGIHLLLDDIGGRADRAHEQLGLFHDRGADGTVAIGTQPVTHRVLEKLPQVGFLRQDVVHPADRLYRLGSHCDW